MKKGRIKIPNLKEKGPDVETVTNKKEPDVETGTNGIGTGCRDRN